MQERSSRQEFLALCRLQPLLDAAHTAAAECDDDTPEIRAADTYCEELHAELDAISERVWSRPVGTWTDALERAAIAFYWAQRDDNNELDDLDSANPPDRAAAELITAVMDLAKGGQAHV